MKKILPWLSSLIWYVILPVIFTFMWFNLPLFIPASEILWGICNKVTGEVNVGYASDLEFIIVIFFGVSISMVCRKIVLIG